MEMNGSDTVSKQSFNEDMLEVLWKYDSNFA